MIVRTLLILTSVVAGAKTFAAPCPPGSSLVNFYVPPGPSLAATCGIKLGEHDPGPTLLPASADHIALCTDGAAAKAPPEVAQRYHYRLLEAAMKNLGGPRRVLVVGSGNGIEAVTLARHFDLRIDATDIDARAVELTRANAERYGVAGKVHAFESDLFDRVDGHYDLVLFNAPRPLLEADHDFATKEFGDMTGIINGVRRSLKPTFEEWLAGFDHPTLKGFYFDPRGAVLFAALDQFAAHLAPGGKFLLMTTGHLPKLPRASSARIKVISEDPWAHDPADTFGIFELTSP